MATFVQAKASTVTTIDQSVAFDSNVTAGNLLVLCMRESTNFIANPSITDSLGNTWTLAQQFDRGFIYYTKSGSSGACTVTIDSQGTIATRAVIFEFGGTWGTAPFHSAATGLYVTASPAASNAVTPSAANGVMVAMLGTVSDTNPHAISSGGYTLGPVASLRVAPAYLLFSSAASYAATYTASANISNGGSLHNIAFTESGGGSPSNAPRSQFYHHMGMR